MRRSKIRIVVYLAFLVAVDCPALAIPLRPNDLIIANGDLVSHVDPSTGLVTTLSTIEPLSSLSGVEVDRSGGIFVVDSGVNTGIGRVLRIDPITGASQTILAGGALRRPVDITLTPDGEILVLDAGHRSILSVDAITGDARTLASSASFGCFSEIAASSSTRAFVSSSASGVGCSAQIASVDLSTGGVSSLPNPGPIFGDVSSIAVNSDGELFAIKLGGGFFVVNVDSSTGATTLIAGNAGSGLLGMAVGLEGEVFLTEFFDHAITAIDIGTGGRRIVAGNIGVGDGIAVVPLPEPSTALMLGLGLPLLRLVARRDDISAAARGPGPRPGSRRDRHGRA